MTVAAVGANYLTIAELVKRMGESSARTILEVAKDNNTMLNTSMVSAGNEVDGNTTVARTDYPTGTWTTAYQGVNSVTSHTKEVRDAAGTLEAYSAIAKRIVDKAPDKKAARMQEIKAVSIGMSQEVEETFFLGDKTLEPKEFTGLLPRYDSLSGETGGQVKDGGGSSTDNTSVWFVTWDPMSCYLFFGKNNAGGLQISDQGLIPWDLAGDGTHIQAWVDHIEWNIGLTVANWKGISRLANIDVSVLTGGSPTTLAPLLIDTFLKIPSQMASMRKAIYCNDTVYGALWKEAQSQSNNNLTMANWEGNEITHFNGIPIHRSDKIGIAESRVT